MDPYYTAKEPDVSGHCPVEDGNHMLFYEVRGRGDKPKIIMVMGAFGTCKQLEALADCLAATYEVVMYDHRGVGRSRHKHPIRTHHTSSLLAEDAVALADHVWGPNTPLHVFGVSMGGFISQMIGLLLLKQQRLLSLNLAVTSRAMHHFTIPLPFWLCRYLVVRRVLRSDRREQIAAMLPKVLPQDILQAPFPGPQGKGRTYREVFQEANVEQYEQRFTFTLPDTCAAQLGLLLRHRLSNLQAKRLRESGVPITVIASSVDRLVAPRMQLQLGRMLGAHLVHVRGGHLMGYPEDRAALVGAILAQAAHQPSAVAEE